MDFRLVALLFYRLLWWIALPFVALRLAIRSVRDPSYRAHWRERFALDLPRGEFDYWIHAVSVGETRAAEPLIKALCAKNPTVKILLTHMTPTGRATAKTLFGDTLVQCYLPYDAQPFAKKFLRTARPRAGVIMETELWPNVINESRAAGIPVWLVNARLSEKSARGYARWPALSRPTLRALEGILAQSAGDAARFSSLISTEIAPQVFVTGNLKFEVAAPVAKTNFKALFGDKMHWVAGATREGDERLLLTALRDHPLRKIARAVIVPRHPQRFTEVFELAESLGFRTQLRSAITAPVAPACEVIIGDSMGEMADYYACADVVFMGGSFTTGSQNLIEPCAAGKSVVLGPSVFNFQAAAEAALLAGAAVQRADAAACLDVIAQLLNAPDKRSAMGQAGADFCAENRGATEKTLAIIAK